LSEERGSRILYHDLFTNGIAYLEVGLDLNALPQKYLPYVRLFGRALLEMGTETEDFVSLTQRISRKTGGIHPSYLTSGIKDSERAAARLFLRGKAMMGQTEDLLGIIRDVLLTVRLDNRERFKQMVLESKARQEQKLVPAGHQIVNERLRAHFSEADWAAEKMAGLSYLFFLRDLARAVDENWPGVLRNLEEMKRILVDKSAMVLNVTLDQGGWETFEPQVKAFLETLPAVSSDGESDWSPETLNDFEGMTIPAQVNYVGKAGNLYSQGYCFHGSAHVICRYLRNSWLWDRVRVQGGAYGAFCLFSRLSGVVSFVSYRDPNLAKTLRAFDESTEFLKKADLSKEELTKAVIGAIGDIDQYQLPDAKGFTSMVRYLSGETDEERQKIREEVLGTTVDDFRRFGEALEGIKENGLVKVLGSENAIRDAVTQGRIPFKVLKVL
jgi:Zn-dependent M16 (insulinase) family peptidase